jgi:predicted phosphoribosyltransferase/nucleotide-binding universal stress UspA family protein
MFRDRQEAADQLACRLRTRVLHDPLVLAIPRGGVVVGAVLAQALGADLDVVLSCRLRAPGKRNLTLGALAEDGTVYLDPLVRDWPDGIKAYLEVEKRFQAAEITRRKELFRAVRPAAPVTGRTVIVTDDGVASGATILSALYFIRNQHPRELIVAVPVCPTERVEEIRRCCEDLVCLHCPAGPIEVRGCYANFPPVKDEEVRDLLHSFAQETTPTQRGDPAPSLFRTILHPTDLAESSEAALHLACSLARYHGSRLVLLHVVEVPAAVYAGGVVVDSVREVNEARTRLQQIRAHTPAIMVDCRLAEGEPAEEIVRLAEDQDCDLIVLGTHGRSGLRRLVLGSVAEQVLRQAPCPVLTVKSPEHP